MAGREASAGRTTPAAKTKQRTVCSGPLGEGGPVEVTWERREKRGEKSRQEGRSAWLD